MKVRRGVLCVAEMVEKVGGGGGIYTQRSSPGLRFAPKEIYSGRGTILIENNIKGQ